MKQALLRIHLPKGQTLFSTQFKELLAKECAGSGVVSDEFFHYRAGAPIPDAMPDITFVGGGSWVGILSRMGNMKSLMAIAGYASKAVSQFAGQPVAMEIEEPEYSIELTDYPVQYFFRDVCSKHANRWKSSKDDLVSHLLLNRLRDERDALNFDLPAADPAPFRHGDVFYRNDYAQVDRARLQERLCIEVHEVESLGLHLKVASGLTNQHVQLMRGTLSMYAKINGIWQFGNLQSRGYGRLIHAKGVRSC